MSATNCISERSSSEMWHVKTNLHSIILQEQLDNSLTLHVHKDFTGKVNVQK